MSNRKFPHLTHSSFFRTTLTLALALPLASAAVACGSGTKARTAADIDAGTMPAEGEWEGVYYSQMYGFLHLTESGGAVQGAWRTTAGDKWGELYGETEGDLLRFEWQEHKIGVVGPNATSEGHGYFRYTIPTPDEPHELKGEWGLGEEAVGHSWDLIKQTGKEPDPKSVRPDEIESRVGAESWDGQKGDPNLKPDEGTEGEPGAEQKTEGEEGAETEGEQTEE